MQCIAGTALQLLVWFKNFWFFLESYKGKTALSQAEKTSLSIRTGLFALIRNSAVALGWLVIIVGRFPCDSTEVSLPKKPLDSLEKLENQHRGLGSKRQFASYERLRVIRNKAQADLYVCYNEVDTYISTVRKRYAKHHNQRYKTWCEGRRSLYRQLNSIFCNWKTSIYSDIRPKRGSLSLATPKAHALQSERRLNTLKYDIIWTLDPKLFHWHASLLPLFMDVFLLYMACLRGDEHALGSADATQLRQNCSKEIGVSWPRFRQWTFDFGQAPQ